MSMKERDYQNLMPDGWGWVDVNSKEDFLFLGKGNLETLKKYWRAVERSVVRSMKTITGYIELLSSHSPYDFYIEAKESYEFPEFPTVDYINESSTILMPTDEESYKRSAGSTTFNCCGWCRYNKGGIGRGDCALKTSCALVPNMIWRYFQDVPIDEFYAEDYPLAFDSPCLFWKREAGQLINVAIDYHSRELERAKENKKKSGSNARWFLNLAKEAEEKPYLPSYRPEDWFKDGDEVMCFIPDDEEGLLPDEINTFVPAVVRSVCQPVDGAVTLYTFDQVAKSDFMDGHGVIFGLSRPEVLKKWEYEYLLSHSKYLSIWLSAIFRMPVDNPTLLAGRLKDALAPIKA